MPKLYNVEAEVHIGANIKNGGFRVKVLVHDLGLFINGMIVYPPNEERNQADWMVLTPARPAGRGKWAHIVEFNKKLPLWEEIYDACVDAAKLEGQFSKDVVIEDIPEGPIDLSGIPF